MKDFFIKIISWLTSTKETVSIFSYNPCRDQNKVLRLCDIKKTGLQERIEQGSEIAFSKRINSPDFAIVPPELFDIPLDNYIPKPDTFSDQKFINTDKLKDFPKSEKFVYQRNQDVILKVHPEVFDTYSVFGDTEQEAKEKCDEYFKKIDTNKFPLEKKIIDYMVFDKKNFKGKFRCFSSFKSKPILINEYKYTCDGELERED